MTSARAALVAALTGSAAATHGLVDARVRPGRLHPADDFPAIVHHRISGPRQYSQDGDSGLEAPRFQLDCWARDPDTADAVAEAVIADLSGRPAAGIRFTTIHGDLDDYEPDTGLFRRIVDVMPHLEN